MGTGVLGYISLLYTIGFPIVVVGWSFMPLTKDDGPYTYIYYMIPRCMRVICYDMHESGIL
jgi:hypothetical protein